MQAFRVIGSAGRPISLRLVLAGLLIIALGGQIWHIALSVSRSFGSARSLETSAPIVVPRSDGAEELAAITRANLFGVSKSAIGNVQPAGSGLVLAGVIAQSDPALGWAILGKDAASAVLLRVGSVLDGATRLLQVYTGYVILERNGRMERLEFPQRNLSAAGFTALIFPTAGPGPQQVAAVTPAGDVPPAAPIMIDNPYGLPRVAGNNSDPAPRFAAVAPGDDPPASPIKIDNPDGLNL